MGLLAIGLNKTSNTYTRMRYTVVGMSQTSLRKMITGNLKTLSLTTAS